MIKRFGILPLLLIMLTGCLKENLDGCPKGNVALSLKYTLNIEGDDQFEGQIGRIKLYIFDNSTGLLMRIEPIDQRLVIGGIYYLNLPRGNYTIVAWGVSGPEIAGGGYSIVELTDPAADTHTAPEVGRTSLESFRMRLNTIANNEGYKTPSNDDFDDLYHAVVENVEVTDLEQLVELSFTKNTNLFKVRVKGLENLTPTRSETPQIELFVTGTDDRYNHLNSACTPNAALHYPVHNSPQSDISVLRLDMELHKAQPIKLHMRQADTGVELMTPIDLLDLILKLRDENGELKFKTQKELDRWDEYEIELNIDANLGVSIEVKGFIITDVGGGLD